LQVQWKVSRINVVRLDEERKQYGLLATKLTQKKTRTATRSCQTRKRAVHFYSPGGVRRSHAAALHVRPAAAAAAAAATAALLY